MRNKLTTLILPALLVGTLMLPASAQDTRADVILHVDKESYDAWVTEQRAPEAALLDAFPEFVSRDDNTLQITAENGIELHFDDGSCYCTLDQSFHIVGYIEVLRSFLIVQLGYDGDWYHLVHKPTGSSVILRAYPEIDNASRQFVAINPGPGQNAGIQIGHESDAGVVLDAKIYLPHFQFGSWISPDRIELDTSRRPMPFGALTDEELALLYLVEGETETTGYLERIEGRWRLNVSIAIPLGAE